LKKAQIKMKTFWLIENDRKRVLNEDENFFIHREVELQIELKKKIKLKKKKKKKKKQPKKIKQNTQK